MDEQSVFLNVPYDKGYEPLYMTLVCTLVCLGLKPRCVLEIRETGRGRLDRTYELLSECKTSIHDLSRVGRPPRFNMPFELGLACGLARVNDAYEVVVLERIKYRLDQTLSDYKGRDPLIHHNRCDKLVGCLLDLFVAEDSLPSPSELRSAARLIRATGREIKREHQLDTIFRPSAVQALVAATAELAVNKGFIAA